MNVHIKKLSNLASVPVYATSGSAGFDLSASEEVLIYSNQVKAIATGLSFAIPEGYELQIRPRSGLSLKTFLRVITGTIDSDYRGEVRIIVENTGDDMKRIAVGDRIAQGIISPIQQVTFKVVDELEKTERGAGGFGSTGIKSNAGLFDLIKQVIK
jgi:dUTP pyrophosphatase